MWMCKGPCKAIRGEVPSAEAPSGGCQQSFWGCQSVCGGWQWGCQGGCGGCQQVVKPISEEPTDEIFNDAVVALLNMRRPCGSPFLITVPHAETLPTLKSLVAKN